jgi:hypothetical protein
MEEERRKAVLLVEAANLLLMPGRKVAKAGEKAETRSRTKPRTDEALIARIGRSSSNSPEFQDLLSSS